MSIRINKLWHVPAYCLTVGVASYYIMILLTSTFALVTSPDGSLSVNTTLHTVFSFLLFALTLIIGTFLFRKHSRLELFLSASTLVIPLLALQLIQFIAIDSTLATQLGLLLAYLTEWSRCISQFISITTGSLWTGAFATCFCPYLFVLFGANRSMNSPNPSPIDNFYPR